MQRFKSGGGAHFFRDVYNGLNVSSQILFLMLAQSLLLVLDAEQSHLFQQNVTAREITLPFVF